MQDVGGPPQLEQQARPEEKERPPEDHPPERAAGSGIGLAAGQDGQAHARQHHEQRAGVAVEEGQEAPQRRGIGRIAEGDVEIDDEHAPDGIGAGEVETGNAGLHADGIRWMLQISGPAGRNYLICIK